MQPDEICARAFKLCEVACFVARIAGEILVGAELGGVHENRDDDAVGGGEGLAHQRQVPHMKSAHGRHEGNGPPLFPPCRNLGPELS